MAVGKHNPVRLLPLLLLLPHLAWSATFYVTTNGNDAADGSLATPWRTIGHAISTAGASNIIRVGQGYYNTNFTDGSPLHFNVAGQTFIASNSVFTPQVFIEANNVTLTNFNVGYRFFGGFSADPVVWFKSGTTNSVLGGGSVMSAAGKNQFGIIFSGTACWAYGVEITNFGPSGVCIETAGNTNYTYSCSIHDNPSVESLHYVWGYYNVFALNTWSNNNDVELPGSHPDLVQSFFAPSWGNIFSNNFAINNSCQFGSLQAVDGPDGGSYFTNAGAWIFQNNVFINTGSKLDVDFRYMQFINNTFYNCIDNSEENHVLNLNWSIYGSGTNTLMVNNLFAICGSDPTSTNQGWFGIDEGTNTQHYIRNSTVSSNNMVTGSGFIGKNSSLLLGPNWVNGSSPKFVYAPSTRIHKLLLTGSTSANQTTNIFGTNTQFTAELSVGDYITMGPYWTDQTAQVVFILSPTNLWTATPIGRGVSTKTGGQQNIQRVPNFDPLPDLHLMAGSPAIDVGATLANNPYGFGGTNRPVALAYDLGAYEGATPEIIPTNMILHITYNQWGGGTNALDSTTNHCNAALFLGSSWWATPGIGPNGAPGASVANGQYMGITNVGPLQNLTNGTISVWAQRTNGVGNGYSYLLDCGFTFPCTNGWTLGCDNGLPTSLYVTTPGTTRSTILTWPDFHNTNWHMFSFTWSNAVVVGYYDGVPFQTNSLPSQVLTLDDANWLTIGAIQHNVAPGGGTFPNAAFLLGYITDIRAYNQALSPSQILDVYSVLASPTPPTPDIPPSGGNLPPQILMHLTFQGWNGYTNVLDTTTNHADAVATTTNGPTLVVGPFLTNAAAHFANNQWLSVTNTSLFEFLTNGTVATWINYDNAVGSGDYFAVDGFYGYPDTNCFWLAAPNSNPTQFRSIVNSGVNTNIVFNDWNVKTNWHHYCITWNGTNITAYFDASPFRTNAQGVDYFHVEDTARWLALGVQHGSHTRSSPTFGWLNGSMSDVRIYNYGLSPSEVTNVFMFGFSGVTMNNGGYYSSVVGQEIRNAVNPNWVPFTYPHPLISGTNNPTITPPVITRQPQSTNIYSTQTALFTVQATGTAPLSYQWTTNGVAAGTNGPALSVGPCPVVWSGMSVVCVVANAGGPTTSSTATLTVLPDPVITSQPANATVGVGGTATFSVTATGQSTLQYQWSKNGLAIGSANASSYTTPITVAGDNNSQFSVLVTDNAGSLQSANATLTVTNIITPPDPVILAQPQSTNIFNNQTASFGITASGATTLHYQWSTNGVNTGTDSSTLALGTCPIAWSGLTVICVVSDVAGSVTSSTATLTISADPVITAQPQNTTRHISQTASFSVTATGQTALSYQWSRNTVAIAGATASSYTTPSLTSGNNGDSYFVDVTDTADTLRSATATLTVVIPTGKTNIAKVKNLKVGLVTTP